MKLAIFTLSGESSKKIAEEAKNYFDKVDLLDLRKAKVNTNTKNLEVLYQGNPLEDYDCAYIRGSHKYSLLQRAMTEALQENVYVPLKPKSFTIGHDKFLTLLELQKNKVPIPTTYLALTVESAKKVLPKIKFPVIMKIPAGTQGKGVMFADSIESANTILDTLEIFKQPFIIQEYIETGATDIRAIVANNKVIAAMKRKATKEELRANIHMGATGEPYIPSYDTEQIIIKAAKALNTEICAVDLLEDLTPKVIEVNTSPGLVGISKATKKNIFRLVAEALYEGTKTFKEYKKSKDYNQVIKEISNRKDIITNLEIKAGKIRLPGVLTKITGFNDEEEVILKVEKNKVTIEKHDM